MRQRRRSPRESCRGEGSRDTSHPQARFEERADLGVGRHGQEAADVGEGGGVAADADHDATAASEQRRQVEC